MMSLNPQIIAKLEGITTEHAKLQQKMLDPDIMSEPTQLQKIGRKLGELAPIVELFQVYQAAVQTIVDAKEMLTDTEMAELAQAEIDEAESQLDNVIPKLQGFLVPKDPNDTKDCLIEIRPGAGGDEAALFAAEMTRAYIKFAEDQGLKFVIIERQDNDAGGIKELIGEITGMRAYAMFKFEAGVHRVQRIPKTESQGRVHTSAISVIVLPKIEEEEFEIDPADLRIDAFRSSGPGGQSVNTTDSAIRITHVPTGIVATSQDEKSQHKNKAKAMSVLVSRIVAAEAEKKAAEVGEKRLAQIGSGDRSDKIRTYNFPQDRVTDHRVQHHQKNFSHLPKIMSGEFATIIAELQKEEALMLQDS